MVFGELALRQGLIVPIRRVIGAVRFEPRRDVASAYSGANVRSVSSRRWTNMLASSPVLRMRWNHSTLPRRSHPPSMAAAAVAEAPSGGHAGSKGGSCLGLPGDGCRLDLALDHEPAGEHAAHVVQKPESRTRATCTTTNRTSRAATTKWTVRADWRPSNSVSRKGKAAFHRRRHRQAGQHLHRKKYEQHDEIGRFWMTL